MVIIRIKDKTGEQVANEVNEVLNTQHSSFFSKPFFTELQDGKLNKNVLKGFAESYWNVSKEWMINEGAMHARFARIWRAFLPIDDLFSAKISRQMLDPRPPGYSLATSEFGQAFGLTHKEMVEKLLKPDAQAFTDASYSHALLYTITECTANEMALSKIHSEMSPRFLAALPAHYGIPADKLRYFSLPWVADKDNLDKFSKALAFLIDQGENDINPGMGPIVVGRWQRRDHQ